MEMVFKGMLMTQSLVEGLRTTLSLRADSHSQTDATIKDHLRRTFPMDEVCMFGQMDSLMMVSGQTVSSTGMARRRPWTRNKETGSGNEASGNDGCDIVLPESTIISG